MEPASDDAILYAYGGAAKRTTITLDDELLARAREMAGIDETSALVRLALKRFIESEAARRLALLGGSDPEATLGPRRFDAA